MVRETVTTMTHNTSNEIVTESSVTSLTVVFVAAIFVTGDVSG